MMKPVMFKTPGGEKMVILPLADYEALVSNDDAEDAADVAAFDAAVARLRRGEDRVLAPAEMAAFHARPGYLRGLRLARGLTQADLATKVGIGQGFLSDIESGRRKGAADTLRKIAAVLGANEVPG